VRGKGTKLGEGGKNELGEGENIKKVRLGQDSLPNRMESHGKYRKVLTLFYPHPENTALLRISKVELWRNRDVAKTKLK
jgi:hypothetical protein